MSSKTAGSRLAALLVFACAAGAADADTFQLSWSVPSQNADNTVLTNLCGYFIYVGSTPDPNAMVPMYYVDSNNTSVSLPYVQGGSGEYVAITSVTSDGLESVKSAILLVSGT